MILIGIDDTDIKGSKNTNQLARMIVHELENDWMCERIVQHQLLRHDRIPCTTRNGCTSILLKPREIVEQSPDHLLLLVHEIREIMKQWFVKGSDPGLCVCPYEKVDQTIVQFGYRCQFELVQQADALQIADTAEIHLEGLGGSHGGLIGALAAVGLGSKGNDGRVVQIGEWSEDLIGRQTITAIQSRGVKVRNIDTDEPLSDGVVELEKKLSPNLRDNQIVLFVQKFDTDPDGTTYQAIKLP